MIPCNIDQILKNVLILKKGKIIIITNKERVREIVFKLIGRGW